MSTTDFPAPVTSAQRLELMRQRARYEPHQQYTPDNAISARVNTEVERQNESSISHIGDRLQDAHTRLQDDRAFAVQEGRAVAEFNQSSQSSAPSGPSPAQDVGHER